MSEAVIRSAKNYLNQAEKPAIVDTEQQKEYIGNNEDDFLDQAAGIEKVSEIGQNSSIFPDKATSVNNTHSGEGKLGGTVTYRRV